MARIHLANCINSITKKQFFIEETAYTELHRACNNLGPGWEIVDSRYTRTAARRRELKAQWKIEFINQMAHERREDNLKNKSLD